MFASLEVGGKAVRGGKTPGKRSSSQGRVAGGESGEKAVGKVISQPTEGRPGMLIRQSQKCPGMPRQFVFGINFIV